MAKDTGAAARAQVAAPSTTLKHRIYEECLKRPRNCYDLEDLLDRSHQSVSGSITYMVREGNLEVLDYTTINRFGNEVRTYRANPKAPVKARKRKTTDKK